MTPRPVILPIILRDYSSLWLALLFLLGCLVIGLKAAEAPASAPRTVAGSHALRQRRLATQPSMATHGLGVLTSAVLPPPATVLLVWSNPPAAYPVYNTVWRADVLPVFTPVWSGQATQLVDIQPTTAGFWQVSASYSVP